jgi:hypothetical protein
VTKRGNRGQILLYQAWKAQNEKESLRMTDSLVQAIGHFVKSRVETLSRGWEETLDFAAYERGMMGLMNEVSATIMSLKLVEMFESEELLARLKAWGAKQGMGFKEYRCVTLTLASGERVQVSTPYFLKAKPKRGRKKQGPNGRGAYLGLELLGFIGRGSPNFVSDVVQMALLSPSFEVAHSILSGRGIKVDVSTIRRYCRQLAQRGMAWRGQVSLNGHEDLKGYTLVVGVDGGRLRERRPKRGRRKKGQKRQGYTGEWREPKLFTIYLLDEQGEVVKEFPPLHDATMGDHTEMFTLLQRYLSALPLAHLSRIVFCGDGASWIWSDIETLSAQMDLEQCCPVYQVLDYTHAQQNLQELIDLLPTGVRKKEKLDKKWRDLLWSGDIQGLRQEIDRLLSGRKHRRALKKWQTYFERNAQRMQYQSFKQAHIPCGSGSVESAIRRIINMRLKSAGSFWTRDMAEAFLFLRSQLLSGRWSIFLRNVVRQAARAWHRRHPAPYLDAFQQTLQIA